MDVNIEINWFRDRLKKAGDSKLAEGEKKYLKSPWKFYGVNTPTKREIVKSWFRHNPGIPLKNIIPLIKKLWSSPWHEEKTMAIMLLDQRKKELEISQFPLIEQLVQESTGWDHLDEIAVHVVGHMIDNDKAAIKYLPKWAKSKNFWVRRAAVLSQILQFRRKAGNKKLFFEIIVPMFDEGMHWSKEERFFIRKAIGWALREIANVEPEMAFKFIKQYKHKMSGLTFREASRKLPDKFRKLLI